ncbi:hypothetical protein L596_004609 [Steinernema carpocapsae]|uniref:Uncharacterized protein n=1 Tax=Steinernema carpocapsae TaxID=34508 RepID=A0A4U8UXU6_STECR|nr:hypothetical protein L596_004609 [Steinernema carpocapsae]
MRLDVALPQGNLSAMTTPVVEMRKQATEETSFCKQSTTRETRPIYSTPRSPFSAVAFSRKQIGTLSSVTVTATSMLRSSQPTAFSALLSLAADRRSRGSSFDRSPLESLAKTEGCP